MSSGAARCEFYSVSFSLYHLCYYLFGVQIPLLLLLQLVGLLSVQQEVAGLGSLQKGGLQVAKAVVRDRQGHRGRDVSETSVPAVAVNGTGGAVGRAGAAPQRELLKEQRQRWHVPITSHSPQE